MSETPLSYQFARLERTEEMIDSGTTIGHSKEVRPLVRGKESVTFECGGSGWNVRGSVVYTPCVGATKERLTAALRTALRVIEEAEE